jgi:hypothetical protein
MLKLNVRVGESIAIGGPTTLRIESKSGQAVGLVFDAAREIPIRIIPEGEDHSPPKPQGGPVGLGRKRRDQAAAQSTLAHDVPGLQRRQS